MVHKTMFHNYFHSAERCHHHSVYSSSIVMFVILFGSCAFFVFMVLAGTLQRQKQLTICYNYQLCTTYFHCVKMMQVQFSTLLLLVSLAKSPCGDQSELFLGSDQNSRWWLLFSRKKISHLTSTSIFKPLAERAAGLVEVAHGTSKVTHTNLARKQYFVGRLQCFLGVQPSTLSITGMSNSSRVHFWLLALAKSLLGCVMEVKHTPKQVLLYF